MPNMYDNPKYRLTMPVGQSPAAYRAAINRAHRDRQSAQMVQLLGEGVGLVGGTALGFATGDPLAGAGLGMKVGSSLGNMGASYFNNQADEAEDPMRQQQLRRQALLQAAQRFG